MEVLKKYTIIGLALLAFSCNSTSPERDKNNINSFPIKEEIPVVKKQPPIDYDTLSWTDVQYLLDSIQIDMRYASTNNFVKEKMYDCNRCFLRPEVALALKTVYLSLREKGLGLKLYDCYRPRPVQQKLWDKMPNASYVTPPWKGSMHNRGAAVDLTIVDENGNPLDMGTPYDFFGKEAHHTFVDHPKVVLDNRGLLKSTMEQFGFRGIRTEWWHYSFRNKSYELSDWVWECTD